MKLQTKLLAAALLLGGAHAAFAADLGTDAGQTITNQATVSFSVGGVPQTAPTPGTADFVVDRKVDVIVDATSGASTAPGATGKMLTFTVTNKTNDTMDYILSAENLGGDDFNAGNLEIWVDDGDGNFNATDPDGAGSLVADTQVAYIDNLAEDATVKVFVLGDIPATPTVADSDTSDVALVAQAADPTKVVGTAVALAESGAADDPAVVDNVFADAAGVASLVAPDIAEDGRHSDTATYTVGAASVTVTKTYKVVYENYDAGTPANSTSYSAAGQLKPIPGALVEYCILVSNGSASTAASDVTISDPVDVDVTLPSAHSGHLTWLADSIRVAADCSDYDAATDSEDDDTTDEATDETDGVSGSFNPATGTVTTTVDSLSGSATTATMFRLIVK
jgi:hypothetical protein